MNDECKDLLAWYQTEFAQFDAAAKAAGVALAERLRDASIEVHLVHARAKSIESLAMKLRKKNYADPRGHTTDLIGIRVITLFQSDVDTVVELLPHYLERNDEHSSDKRDDLGASQFGYRSVHFVGPLSTLQGVILPDAVLGFQAEIQVRSVLEHAWAEMEHELVYKRRTNYSDDTQRNIAAVAGTLELMDVLFEGFRSAFDLEVQRRHDELSAGESWNKLSDAAAVVAAFELIVGTPCGWRSPIGAQFPAHSPALVCEALSAAELTTPQSIQGAFAGPSVGDAILSFAALKGITGAEVSHLAIGALISGMQPGFDRADFPDLFTDGAIVTVLSGQDEEQHPT
jgi:ppGpp synthetase/RelA/SpoT-type nucleotidyltranferase